MATTMYYGEYLQPVSDPRKSEKPDKIYIEVFVSSVTGEHELYLKVIDQEERDVILSKAQAQELLGGLEGAMHYLRYLK